MDDKTSEELAIEFHKLVLASESIDDIANKLTKKKADYTAKEFNDKFSEIGSYEELTKRMLDSFTDAIAFYRESLGKVKKGTVGDEYKYVNTGEDDEVKDFTLKNSVMDVTKSLNGAEVSGKHAKMLVLAANKNVKKIYLYNSGFYIVLRGPDLVELNLVYNRLNDEMNEYGRIFGAIFYMYADFKIKEIIWDFIESLIIDTNLERSKGAHLREAVSFLDYNFIILSIGTLMFKNGYQFISVCTGTEDTPCEHTIEENIDLSMFQLTNFSKVPQNKLHHLSKNTVIKVQNVSSYKDAIDQSEPVTIGQYKIYRKVPSMADYFKHGNKFNDDLYKVITDLDDEDALEQYLRYNYSILFTPWIDHIEAIGDDGDVSFKIKESEIIDIVLNQIQASEELDEFRKSMVDYIIEATITNVGYISKACEVCGKEPSNTVNGFIPFDPQNSFFTMSVMRLIQAS
jgi:hypothetical protein